MALRYDLLVIDLDGTLLSSSGVVSGPNRDALEVARDAGLTVIVASGRSFAECRPILEGIEYEGHVIAAGGCLLCDGRSGETLRRSTVCPTVVAEVSAMLVEDNHRAMVLKDRYEVGYDYLLVGTAALDPASERWFEMLPVELHCIDTLDDDEEPHASLRVGAVSGVGRLQPIAERLRDTLEGRAYLHHWGAVTEQSPAGGTHAGTHLLEVFAPEVNKWTMVRRYCDDHGVDHERVAAIGDGVNDVALIENAALGVAMKNAFPEVIEVADRVTLNHDEDGVARAVERIVTGVW